MDRLFDVMQLDNDGFILNTGDISDSFSDNIGEKTSSEDSFVEEDELELAEEALEDDDLDIFEESDIQVDGDFTSLIKDTPSIYEG